MVFPPFFIPILAFLHEPLGVESLRYEGRSHGGDSNPAPALVRVLHQLADDQGRQDSGHPYPVTGGAGTYGTTRMAKRSPFLPFDRRRIVSVWLCFARFHCTHRLWRGCHSVKRRNRPIQIPRPA